MYKNRDIHEAKKPAAIAAKKKYLELRDEGRPHKFSAEDCLPMLAHPDTFALGSKILMKRLRENRAGDLTWSTVRGAFEAMGTKRVLQRPELLEQYMHNSEARAGWVQFWVPDWYATYLAAKEKANAAASKVDKVAPAPEPTPEPVAAKAKSPPKTKKVKAEPKVAAKAPEPKKPAQKTKAKKPESKAPVESTPESGKSSRRPAFKPTVVEGGMQAGPEVEVESAFAVLGSLKATG